MRDSERTKLEINREIFFLIHMIRILFYILIIFYVKCSLLYITLYINDLKRKEASEAKI